MRRLFPVFVAASLILAAYATFANAAGPPSRPPIEQPLVSEGEFAVELANALNLSSSHDETAAENSLGSANIAPKNGWISNYPMTPDIISEVRESAARSASAGTLKMSEADAAGAVDSVGIAMNLPVRAGGGRYGYEARSGSSSESQSSSSSEYESGPEVLPPPPPEVSQYEEPGAVDEYYDEYGPPVVTYYPPPWAYGYLYDWVPYPFWWGGFGFGGFFVLGDFDVDRHDHHRDHHDGRHDHGGQGRHRISNHVTNANGTVGRINAVTRASTGTRNASLSASARSSGSATGSRFGSASAQAGAWSILNRQTGSTATAGATASTVSRNLASPGTNTPAAASRNMENTGGSTRNPVTVMQNMRRASSGGSEGTIGRGAASAPSSLNMRTLSGNAPARYYSGGYRNSGGFGGYRSSGGFGGYRGGGMGGHGGAMGHGGGGGHR